LFVIPLYEYGRESLLFTFSFLFGRGFFLQDQRSA